MTSASSARSPHGLGSGIEALRAKRGWIIALGNIYVVAGWIVVGIMMLIARVTEIINAFQVKSWGKFLFFAGVSWNSVGSGLEGPA